MEILHITAHLGGGIGKVLSGLVEASAHNRYGVHHTIACLEVPEKTQFVDHVRSHGGNLLICPSLDELTVRASEADIVQVEWWHHPVVASWLGRSALPAMRLVVWSHVSGLYLPALSAAFVAMPDRFLFTSPCSGAHPRLAGLDGVVRQRVDTVFSSGGFDNLPEPPLRSLESPLQVGYLGTLNFAKLHPRLLDYLAAVDLPDFRLILIGDPTTSAELMDQAQRRGLDSCLEIRGYRTDVAAELVGLDVLAYLLNPLHYGTTENALLEAMAMGVVPVVLNNPAERYLVRHGETGLVVDSPAAFAAALQHLADDPKARHQMSQAAVTEVRYRFAVDRTAKQLTAHYRAILAMPKRPRDFRPLFGEAPADWFRSCLGDEAWRFRDDGGVDLSGEPPHCLFERSKGSVFHYQRTFPGDGRLAAWVKAMVSDL